MLACPCLSHLQGLAGHNGSHNRYPIATNGHAASTNGPALPDDVVYLRLRRRCPRLRQVYANGLQCLKGLVAPTPSRLRQCCLPPSRPMSASTAHCYRTAPRHTPLRIIVRSLQNAVNELLQPMPGSSRFHN
ncbi:hypothetical protein CORC01_10128 [Colletotrichum orchidophilum]|uniref:Uncharacterized protein n=1 Tax=Colletotrichum orchidophilum TaxID=1209926 RepID=A0A1G4AZK7_9PEZI|nr:uncharacterized protein CORC01_10128 [Colletotrichum orchidophilum]OHE94600.1 hypothetical protein CORC01_10128 [Colletotrichum orchidophilum]